jgi:SAM-dependent methyltransferase
MTESTQNENLRFGFGANWSHYLKTLSDDKIDGAEKALKGMLGVDSLGGKSFFDIGSGSGLMSLCARRLGARVHSFDYDHDSVRCTELLKNRYFKNDSSWLVERGSVLDAEFMSGKDSFDVVYSWGVLHHTGKMWDAIDAAAKSVAKDGLFFLAIYNDQGPPSKYWTWVKKAYNRSPLFKYGLIAFHLPYLFFLRYAYRFITGRLEIERGMTMWYDMLDWLGGYPFEVAKPEEVLHFLRQRGFVLLRMQTCAGRMGCNEFVFSKT